MNEPVSPSRRDLILMTGVAAAGAVAATRGSWAPEEQPPAQAYAAINVRDHGAIGDGAADDSTAVRRALRSAQASGQPATLYFPQGTYSVRAGTLVVPAGHPMTIRGDGAHASQISLREEAQNSDALVALNATFAAIENLQIDGGGTTGDNDLLVLNAGYNRVSNCNISRSPATGIAVGRHGRSLAHVLENIIVRDCGAYGIRVHGTAKASDTGSTDGLWSNVDVGRSGLSGIFLESSSQNMSNVHVWQSGVRGGDNGDQHGFRVASRTHIFAGCQAEKNLGDGFHFDSGGGEGSVVSGCRVWENGGSGLVGEGTGHLTLIGSTFTRNGRINVGDAAADDAVSAAAIRNEGGDAWTITGCSAWDDSRELSAVWVPEDSTTPEIPRRGAGMSQTFAYVETGSQGRSSITGAIFRAEEHLSGQSIKTESALLRVSGSDLGEDDAPSIRAATTVALPPWGDVIRVTGSQTVTKVGPSRPGRVVTLIFDDASSGGIVGSSNVRMRGDFVPDKGSSVTLVCVGENWQELARSV
ncbi:glycosyl hydrolase family 28-related protein [Microbacterium sp. KSW4-17]|uniref:Glycosyl hydrolase family 28-related protein n=1 Tax=Microbacterium galbum TaxID=3075994 RepID=A0ABU3T4V5_9MICO|nr:glycosyl hydrolase family 28-related protein [Microbacterium sp. KSW4-17]MDU0366389.1 glycosyl hydrolase family 28-related protein [Microbacterium sp. KSW4-17]